MKRILSTLAAASALALPAASGANDYTITIPAGAANTRFEAVCSMLNQDLGLPANWTLEKCARKFLRMGAEAYFRRKTSDDAFSSMGASIEAAVEGFNSDFPDQ